MRVTSQVLLSMLLLAVLSSAAAHSNTTQQLKPTTNQRVQTDQIKVGTDESEEAEELTEEDDSGELEEESEEVNDDREEAEEDLEEIQEEEEEEGDEAEERSDVGNFVVGSGYKVEDPRDRSLKFNLLPEPQTKQLHDIRYTTVRPVSYSSVVYDPDDNGATSEFYGDYYDKREPTTVPGPPQHRSVQTPLSSIRHQDSRLVGYDYDYLPYQGTKTQVQKPYVMRPVPKFVAAVHYGFPYEPVSNSLEGEQQRHRPVVKPTESSHKPTSSRPYRPPSPTQALANTDQFQPMIQHYVRPTGLSAVPTPILYRPKQLPGTKTQTQFKDKPQSAKGNSAPGRLYSKENSNKNRKIVQKFEDFVITQPKYKSFNSTKPRYVKEQGVATTTRPFPLTKQGQRQEPVKSFTQNVDLLDRKPQNFENKQINNQLNPISDESRSTFPEISDNDDFYSQVLANIESVFGNKVQTYPSQKRQDHFIPEPIIPVDYEAYLNRDFENNSYENLRNNGNEDEDEESNEELNEELEDLEDHEELEEEDEDGSDSRRNEVHGNNRYLGNLLSEDSNPRPRDGKRAALVTKRLASESSQLHSVMTDSLAMPSGQKQTVMLSKHSQSSTVKSVRK